MNGKTKFLHIPIDESIDILIAEGMSLQKTAVGFQVKKSEFVINCIREKVQELKKVVTN